MKNYIENINTFEKRNKVNTTQWRKIYEVKEEDYFKESDIFPDDFIKKCKDNVNEAINIQIEVKKIHEANGNGTRIICTSRQDKLKGFEIDCRK